MDHTVMVLALAKSWIRLIQAEVIHVICSLVRNERKHLKIPPPPPPPPNLKISQLYHVSKKIKHESSLVG